MFPSHSSHQPRPAGARGALDNGLGPRRGDDQEKISARQRLEIDDSRALPPDFLRFGRDGRLLVPVQFEALLGRPRRMDSGDKPYDQYAPPDHNVPPSSYRFLSMSPLALMEELARRAIGEGPPDEGHVSAADIFPESRRFTDIKYALEHQPDRERDLRQIATAGEALGSFFVIYRSLVQELRSRRPDLQPVMRQWCADLVRPPLRQALRMPPGPGADPQHNTGVYENLWSPLQRPFGDYVAELEARKRFADAAVPQLLAEAAQRAVGYGPADLPPSSDRHAGPEVVRIKSMVHVLNATPGREGDALILRNAGRLLDRFFADFRGLHRRLLARRPDFAPVIADWSAGVPGATLARALATPGIADPDFRPDESQRYAMGSDVPQRLDIPIAELQVLLEAHQRRELDQRFPAFFAGMSRPRVPGGFIADGLRGASSQDRAADVQRLLRCELVLQCTEARLPEHLRMIPAGAFGRHDVSGQRLGPSARYELRSGTDYPEVPGGNTISAVFWESTDGHTIRVFVADIDDIHSYSIDDGEHWHPTGAPTSDAMNTLRAERWSAFIAQRRAAAAGGAS